MSRATLLIPVLLVLAAAPLHAQEGGAQEPQELDLRATEFIHVEGSLPFVPASNTIATKLPLPLELTPSHVGVVTRALIEQQYGQVLGDALQNVSNVNVQPGFGVHDFFVVRGFDSLSSSLVLIDGAPEPEASFYQLYNVELVEVLKGPAGFLYGSNPLAAAVNLVRKQPRAARQLRIGGVAGSFATFEGTADASWVDDSGTLMGRLNALVRDAGSWREGKDSTVAAVNPALTWLPGGDRRLNVNFELASSDFTPDAGIPVLLDQIVDVDRGADYNAPSDFSDQVVIRFQADWEMPLSDSVTLRDKLYYRGLRWDSDGTLIVGAAPLIVEGDQVVGFGALRTQILLRDEQDVLGNQLEAVIELDAGATHHDLLAGFEYTRHTDEFTLDVGLLPPVDLFDPQPDPTPAFPIPGQRVRGAPRIRVVAPYAVDQITLGERVQLLAGLRFDAIDFADELTGRERSDAELSPLLGAVFQPRTDLSLYANVARSFAPPSPRAFGPLAPEESRQLEIGLKAWLLDRRARLTGAAYWLERENIAIPDDNGFTQQIGNQRSRGLEAELALEPGGGFRAVASWAYNDAELTEFAELVPVPGPDGTPVPTVIDRSGNRPVFAPEQLLDVWASQALRDGLAVGVGARWVGEQFIAEDNLAVVPSAFTLSAMAAYDWSRYRLSLHVENATDTRYFLRGFGARSVTPATPIAAWLRFSFLP